MGNICERYANVDGWLRCGVLLNALETFSWRQHYCVIESNPSRGRNETLVAARQAFVMSGLSGLSSWGPFTEDPKEFGLDVFQQHTKGEEKYVR